MLDFIKRYVAHHRHAPLIREIQTECGISSYKPTVDRLNALEHKGFIKRRPNKHRGILLCKPASQPQEAPMDAATEPVKALAPLIGP